MIWCIVERIRHWNTFCYYDSCQIRSSLAFTFCQIDLWLLCLSFWPFVLCLFYVFLRFLSCDCLHSTMTWFISVSWFPFYKFYKTGDLPLFCIPYSNLVRGGRENVCYQTNKQSKVNDERRKSWCCRKLTWGSTQKVRVSLSTFQIGSCRVEIKAPKENNCLFLPFPCLPDEVLHANARLQRRRKMRKNVENEENVGDAEISEYFPQSPM